MSYASKEVHLKFPWNYIIGIPVTFMLALSVIGILVFAVLMTLAVIVAPIFFVIWLLVLIF